MRKLFKHFLLDWLDMCPNCKVFLFSWSIKKHYCPKCGKTDEELWEEI